MRKDEETETNHELLQFRNDSVMKEIGWLVFESTISKLWLVQTLTCAGGMIAQV
jgi:hypothetical protein